MELNFSRDSLVRSVKLRVANLKEITTCSVSFVFPLEIQDFSNCATCASPENAGIACESSLEIMEV